jgi:hypothetical protein
MPKPNTRKQTPRKRPQPGEFRPGEQHPEEYRRDLNPDAMAGQNLGIRGPGPTSDIARSRSAYDLKDAHRLLQDMDDDVLKGIPILPPGSRLEQGATYLDLADPNPREFTGGGNQTVSPDSWIVPKARCDYNIWNRLIGVTNPERLGIGSER